VSLARKYDAPLIPINVKGPFSFYYHAFDLISRELRNITLFRELLNKAGRRYEITIGALTDLKALKGDADCVTRRLRDYVRMELPKEPNLAFRRSFYGLHLWSE
jgi:putative hemolysin